jgi:enoyl-CoA hydratase
VKAATTTVLTGQVGKAMVITLNRPERRNAVDSSVARGVAAALDELDRDDDLRIGIVTGAGGTFCTGRDLQAFLDGDNPTVPGRGLAGIVRRSATKPLIAAVEGFAVAGGFEIALACDLIVAARGSRFGLPEVRRSLVPSAGALLRLPERLPQGIVMELALTGGFVPATRLWRLGVVNRLSEPDEALDDALELAEEIAAGGPLSITAITQIVRSQRDWSEEEFWDRQAEIVDPVFASEDAQEGASAFLENRQPIWRGR